MTVEKKKRAFFLFILIGALFIFFGENNLLWPQSSRTESASNRRIQENPTVQNAGHAAVVIPSAFVPALKPWVDYRRSQGYIIHLIPEQAGMTITPELIQRQIKALAARVPLTALLIVGDAVLTDDSDPAQPIIPAPRLASQVIQGYGQENHIASDAWYADLDGDTFPDLAVGRFPVKTPEELTSVIKKTIYYETAAPPGEWQRKISFIAGLGGFSPLLDNVINNAVRKTLGAEIPDDFDFQLAQANWKSPYCPDPKMFRFITLDQINQGPLFWVYMGHGFHQGLDYLATPEGNYPIMTAEDLRHIQCEKTLPILLFCACYTGAYDASETSLAEEAFLLPQGPAAVLASSRTSMPYGMAVFGVEMIEEAFLRKESPSPQTLGGMILTAKRRMDYRVPKSAVKTDNKTDNKDKAEKSDTSAKTEDLPETPLPFERSKTRKSLDDLAKVFDPTSPRLDLQLADHRYLFNLFGDPLLRIRFAKEADLNLPAYAYAGDDLTVTSGKTPDEENSSRGQEENNSRLPSGDWSPIEEENTAADESDVLVELVYLPTRRPLPTVDREEYSLTDSDRIAYQKAYEESNNRVLSSVTGKMRGGEFSLTLPIPSDLFGTYIVRVLVTSPNETRIGAKRIKIRRRPKTEDSSESSDEGDSLTDGAELPESEPSGLDKSERGEKTDSIQELKEGPLQESEEKVEDQDPFF